MSKSYFEKCFKGIYSVLEVGHDSTPNNNYNKKSPGYRGVQPNYKGMDRRKI